MELMDMLYKGQDEQSIGIVAMENGDETQEQTYEKVGLLSKLTWNYNFVYFRRQPIWFAKNHNICVN